MAQKIEHLRCTPISYVTIIVAVLRVETATETETTSKGMDDS